MELTLPSEKKTLIVLVAAVACVYFSGEETIKMSAFPLRWSRCWPDIDNGSLTVLGLIVVLYVFNVIAFSHLLPF